MPGTLVALDLDGTLLDHDGTLPAGHERTVHELSAHGCAVAIVTGRPLLTARWVHAHLRLATPLVCFNGGWVGVPGQAPLYADMLSEDDVRTVIAALAGEDGVICGYPHADRWLVDRDTEHTRDWPRRYQTAISVAPECFAPWQGPSCKLMFVAPPPRLAHIAERLRQRFARRFHVVISQDDRFEISRQGITKAWGLERLAAHLGVPRERVWAVGDAANDAEMIRWAGHGCAMGEAPLALRQQARHVLPGVTARGLCVLPHLMHAHA